MARVARAIPWEVEVAVNVLDASLALCLHVCQGWLVLVVESLRDCLLQRHVMEIAVGILRNQQW